MKKRGDETGGPLDAQGYRYAAFISYRHVEPDRKWARWLHSRLETYRIPKKLRQLHNLPARVGRCFRDEEELPASDNLGREIDQALRESKYLIIICSPRVISSQWCNKEVERFCELERHDRILALLIEGEPSASFLPALRDIRSKIVDTSGLTREQVQEVEPLAADVRPGGPDRGAYVRRMAQLRLLATLLGLRFDDLRQREQERRARSLARFVASAVALTLLMAGLYAYAVHQRNLAESRRIGEATQRKLAQDNAVKEVAARKEAQRRLAESDVARGDGWAKAGRWETARAAYEEGRQTFEQLRISPITADLGMAAAEEQSPYPLIEYAAHSAPILAAALSPDGAIAATAAEDGTVVVRSIATGKTIRAFRVAPIAATTTRNSDAPPALIVAAFSPDALTLLVASTKTQQLALYDMHSGLLKRAFASAGGTPNRMAFSADGRRAACLWDQKGVDIFDVGSGQKILSRAVPERAFAVALSPDGARLVTGGFQALDKSETMLLFDLAGDAKPIRKFDGHWMGVLTLAFSLDGTSIASGGNDHPIRLWDAATPLPAGASGSQTREFNGHEDIVFGVAFSPDGRTLASAGRDGTLRLWDAATEREIHNFSIRGEPASAIAFSADSRLIICGGADGVVHLFDAAGGSQPLQFSNPQPGLGDECVAISPDGTLVLTGHNGSDKGIWLWDAATGHVLKEMGYSGYPRAIALLPDGLHAVANSNIPVFESRNRAVKPAGYDQVVQLWDLLQGRVLETFRRHSPEPTVFICTAVSPKGDWLAAEGLNNTIQLWPIDPSALVGAPSGAPEAKPPPPILLTGHTRPVTSLAFSPDGSRLLSGSIDSTARVWDVPSGRNLKTLDDAHGKPLSAVAFAPDGASVLTGGDAAEVTVWDMPSGTLRHQLPGHLGFIASASFLGGPSLAISAGGLTLRAWDLNEGRELRSWSEGDDPTLILNGCAAASDGRVIVSVMSYSTPQLRDFSRPARYRHFAALVPAVLKTLGERDNDPDALAVLGEWYAFRGHWEWAGKCLETARAGGAAVSALTLARCDWETGQYDDARREFNAAAARHEAPGPYLELCLQALENESKRQPPLAPAARAPADQSSTQPTEPDSISLPSLGPPIDLKSHAGQ